MKPATEGATRLSFKNALFVVNAEYLASRALSDTAYRKALLGHGAVATRFERIRREYSAIYRTGHPMLFREKDAPENTYCIASAARIFDKDKEITKVLLESNILEANLRYDNPDVQPKKGAEKPFAEINAEVFTFLMKGIVLDDERSRAGLGGILVAAARCAPELINADKIDDDRAEAEALDVGDKDREPQIVQPGVVFCRASAILSPNDIDRPDLRVAVLSERHVLILLLAANVQSTEIKTMYSFAWPKDEHDTGGDRVFVMNRRVYRDLLYRARHIAKHLTDNLVPMGQASIQIKSMEKPRPNVRMTVLVDYVRLCASPDLLYRTGDSMGLFHGDQMAIYMCLHGNAGDRPIVSRRHEEKEDIFAVQLAFGKGIMGGTKDRGNKRCEQVLEEYLATDGGGKSQNDQKESKS